MIGDMKAAARVLTLTGFLRYMAGKPLRDCDFKLSERHYH